MRLNVTNVGMLSRCFPLLLSHRKPGRQRLQNAPQIEAFLRVVDGRPRIHSDSKAELQRKAGHIQTGRVPA